jgi:hypothetical protein
VLAACGFADGAGLLVSSSPRNGLAGPAELIDIFAEGPDLFGEMPEPRIDFVFQGHENERFVFSAYTFRRDGGAAA